MRDRTSTPPARERDDRLTIAGIALALVGIVGAYLYFTFPAVLAAIAITIGVSAAVGIAGTVGVGLLGAYNQWARWRVVEKNKAIALQLAEHPMPNVTTYSPRTDTRTSTTVPQNVIDVTPQATLPPGIPTFAQLLDAGKIGLGRPLLLGFRPENGTPVEGSWDDLYSTGIGALQGAGKSWLGAFLLAQCALQGGRMIICDLNAGHAESLATRIAALSPAFMCDVANTPEAILSALKLAGDKLAQRRDGRGGNWDIIVAVDEWTSLLRTKVGDVLPSYAEDIAEQGRKYHINGMFLAQGWTKGAASDVRNRLTSHFVMRQNPQEARYQLGLPAAQIPLDVRLLPDATGYLLKTNGELIKFVVPHMTTADLARVGALIPQESSIVSQPFGFHRASTPLPAITAEATRKRPGSDPAEAASTATGSHKTISPEALRAAGLFRQNMSEKAIIKELRGIEGGRNYDAVRDDVRRLIIEGLNDDNE